MQYGLIGEKLGHSWSKIIHESFGLYSYELKELSPDELGPFLEAGEFKGLNVTIPYKRAVIPYLDSVDDAALAIGAVNTIVNRDGRLEGHNTDVTGFRFMLATRGIDPFGKKVLILGTGGASAAVKAGLLMDGASEIVFVSRKKGETSDPSALTVTYEEACLYHTDADIIVNATPVGMYPKTDASPIDLEPFKKCEAVCDIIYNPQVTRLAAQAESLGMTAVTGLDMLVQQAVDAAGFFLGRAIAEDAFARARDEVARVMRNTVKGHVLGGGIPLICVPVMEKGAEAVIARMREAAGWDCEAVEWRADAFEGLNDPSQVRSLLNEIVPLLADKILIFTVRTSSDGGQLDIDRGDYFELCRTADECGCDMIDIELNAGTDDIKGFICQKHSARVIVSYHDFEKTPAEEEMLSLMRAMRDTGADAVKLAVMPQTEADVDRLMEVTRRMHTDHPDVPFITMSMGALGQKSRYLGERYGSVLSFGAVGDGSAPGQMSLPALREKLLAVHEGRL